MGAAARKGEPPAETGAEEPRELRRQHVGDARSSALVEAEHRQRAGGDDALERRAAAAGAGAARGALDGGVARAVGDRPAVDGAEADQPPIAERAFLFAGNAGVDQTSELDLAAGIEQQIESLARGEEAALVLALDALATAELGRDPAQALELRRRIELPRRATGREHGNRGC